MRKLNVDYSTYCEYAPCIINIQPSTIFANQLPLSIPKQLKESVVVSPTGKFHATFFNFSTTRRKI